MTVDVELK
jgi:hypothetical protein